MTEKSNLPLIRFKGFTSPWEQRKFGDNFRLSQGVQVPVEKQFIERGKNAEQFIRIIDVTQEKEPPRYICNNTGKGKVDTDDLFFVRYGAVGIIGYGYNGVIANNLFKTEPLFKANNRFLYHQFSGTKFNDKLKDISASTSMPAINFNSLKNLSFSSTSYKEQEKIGLFFSSIDNFITLHQRKYEKLLNVKKSLLEKMFSSGDENVPKLRFKGFTSTWEQRKLKELGKTFTGLSGKTSSDFGHGKAKFITYMNVFQNPIASKSATEPIEIDNRQNKVKYGDIFFTTSSETPEEVGMSSIWLENTENTYLNSFCFGYRLNNNEKINLQFLAYLLRASNFRSNMMLLAQGISRYNISKNKVIEINISLPIEIDEQNKIGQLFLNLDNLITLHQRKLEKLKNIKKSLLEKMFA